MICVIAADEAERLVTHLNAQGEKASVVGTIIERTEAPVTFAGKLAL